MFTVPERQIPMRRKQKSFGDQDKFLARVTKTLHYGRYPKSDCTSLPVTEIAAKIFSRAKNRLSIDLLDVEEAARLSRRASVSPCSLVLALIYLDRLKSSNPKYLAQVPPSQLFLISIMVGSKFLQDDGQDDEVYNCKWATYAGMTIQNINRAEKEFLKAIDWEVYVRTEEFWKQLEEMEQLVGLREGCKRGWFSYSELSILLHMAQVSDFVSTISKIWVMCIASYATSVLAVVGSTMLIAQIPGLTPTSPAATAPPRTPSLDTRIPYSHDQHLESCNDTDLSDQIAAAVDSSLTQDFSILISNLPSNRTEYCKEVDSAQRLDYAVGDNSVWEGLQVDWRSLWLSLEVHDPATNWAETVQRYLIHETVPNLLISRFY